MKRFLTIWIVLSSMVILIWGVSYAVPAALASDKPDSISVAYCTDCVQFHFQNKDGEANGLIIDMWRLWSEKTGIAIEFKPATWEETLRMVADGRADAHAGLFFNTDRARFLEYGTSLTETDTQFFVHKDLPGIETVEDLIAYKVGVLSGDYVESFLKNKLPAENITGFDSYEEMMEALSEGRLQAFAADTPTGIFHLQKSGLGYVFEAPASKPLYTEKWFVATAKGNTDLIKIINTGMELVSNNERREIEQRWVSISNPVEYYTQYADARLNLTAQERQWLAAHPVIRVHNETDWPPFNFFEENKPQGFSIDYMNLLAKYIDVEVKYVTGPTWNEFLGFMKSGELDVMLNIVKTPERQKYLLYTQPYAFNPNTILSRRETPYSDLDELSGKTVALPKGFFYEEILKRDYPRINLHLVKNVGESLKAVAFGKADAALGELAVFNYLLDREMMTGLVLSGEVKLGGANYAQLNIATRKDLPDLISILNKAMKVVTPEEIKALRQRWISVAATAAPVTPKLTLTANEKAWLAEHKHIRLGVDPAFPPFEYIAALSELSGQQVVIISDFNMPVMHGLDLLKTIRTGKGFIDRSTPFAMLTGHSDNILVEIALALDISAFLIKPISKRGLEHRLCLMLRQDYQGKWVKSVSEYQVVNMDAASDNIPVAQILDKNAHLSQSASTLPVNEPLYRAEKSSVEREDPRGRQCSVKDIPKNAMLTQNVYTSNGRMLVEAGGELTPHVTTLLSDLFDLGYLEETIWIAT